MDLEAAATRATTANVVERSLITLKAMTFRPTGGLVAAMTTSLPESIGGPRNWDYRYCWLRDTTFTLLAMTTAGYFEEAAPGRTGCCAPSPAVPIRSRSCTASKASASWWSGRSTGCPVMRIRKPVRIGNAASGQLQLDIYGEMLDTFFHALHGLGQHTEEDFPRPDAAARTSGDDLAASPTKASGRPAAAAQQFTYSKMMAWVAFDRAILIAEKLGCEAPVERWEKLRDTIHEEICRKAFNKEKNAFVQFYGADQLDASLLLMPLVGFLPATDPRVQGTIEAIERELMPGGFVLRYDTSKVKDGLPPGEGVFLACSFWMVSCLKAIGRMHDARALFERLLGLCNDVGLLSEEYDVNRKRLVGNFPQAFSHISLVNAAFDLVGKDGARQRAHRRGAPVETKA